jgi:hypothetical protein
MQCNARILQEESVYTIGEIDFVATRQCGVATTKSILSEGGYIAICEACTQIRKKKSAWHGWFDDTMPSDVVWVHSRKFYDALLEAYKGEGLIDTTCPGEGLGDTTCPGDLYKWFQKNLAEGEKEELEEELGELKERFESMHGNKPEDMPFGEFLGMVKRRVEIEKRLRLLTSSSF